MNLLDELENLLLLCLCEKLAAAARPVCACHHYGGETPPPGDRCSQENGRNGQAWVRRVSSQLTSEADDITFAGVPCGAGSDWTTIIELGVYRCITAIPAEDGSAPPPENYDADRALLAADRATLAELLCCWPFAGTPPEDYPYDMSGIALTRSEITPTGPTGSCAGSVLTLTISSALIAPALEELQGIQVFVSGPAGGA